VSFSFFFFKDKLLIYPSISFLELKFVVRRISILVFVIFAK